MTFTKAQVVARAWKVAPSDFLESELWYCYEYYEDRMELEVCSIDFADDHELCFCMTDVRKQKRPVDLYYWGCSGDERYKSYEEALKRLLKLGFTKAE